MSSLRNPKALTEWLQLDYFRRPRRLKALWKPVVLATLAGGVLAMVALAVAQKKLAPHLATAYQAGPLSSSHALFNADCARCHVEAFKTWDRLWQFDGNIRAVPDSACLQCHPGPVHQPDLVRQESCTGCHCEHRGHASLARVPDGHCASCHGDLKVQLQPDTEPHFQSFTTFADHPPFQQRWQGAPQDPGTIAFNHRAHLHNSPRVLQCGDCHVPDEAGRAMKPIRYETHCKECHSLTVWVTSQLESPPAREALAAFRRTPAPHQPPEVVRAVMRDRLTVFIQGNPAFLGTEPQTQVPRPIPGSKAARPDGVNREDFEWVNKQLREVEKPLFASRGGCGYCHREIDADIRPGDALPRYAPSAINERDFSLIGKSSRWFPHSRFRHSSHRMMDCQQCHPAAGSEKTSDVLVPTLDNCRQCHGSRSGAGARSDCIKCHTYHPRTEQRVGSSSERGAHR
jgi:hypothetical protein